VTTRENGEQRGGGSSGNDDFAGVALARPWPETTHTTLLTINVDHFVDIAERWLLTKPRRQF